MPIPNISQVCETIDFQNQRTFFTDEQPQTTRLIISFQSRQPQDLVRLLPRILPLPSLRIDIPILIRRRFSNRKSTMKRRMRLLVVHTSQSRSKNRRKKRELTVPNPPLKASFLTATSSSVMRCAGPMQT